MALTVDELVKLAVASPHIRAQRVGLADAIDEHNAADAAVAAAVRDDARGPRVLRAVWQEAQNKETEPDYRLLWAVVTFGLDAAPVAVPVVPPVVIPPFGGTPGVPGDRRRDEDEDDFPWTRRPDRRRWVPNDGPRVVPLTPGGRRDRDRRDRERFERTTELAEQFMDNRLVMPDC
mgnify:CR=1 FL=1